MDGDQAVRSAAATRYGYDGETKSPSFSIAPKQELWNPGRTVLDTPRRLADLYLFAWHPEVGPRADHRRTDQWQFYVLPESDLPNQKSITLSRLEELTQGVSHDELPEAVEEARMGLDGPLVHEEIDAASRPSPS